MSIFYKSKRVGKNGKVFTLYKFRTLVESSDHFPSHTRSVYTPYGRFLRKTKLDELPQIFNLLRGDMNLVGPRPEEERTIDVIPEETRKILLSRKPGLTSLASIHFFDEGHILEKSKDPHEVYWKAIKPMKIQLDIFYIQNRDIFLDLWILWKTCVLVLKSILRKG